MGFAEYLRDLSNHYPNIAYVYASIGYCSLAFLQIVFKYVCRTVSPFQALFMRAFCLFLLNTYILRQAGESPYIRNSFVFRQMLKRLMFSTTYALLTHYCVKYLPVSTVTTLSNTGPIFIFFVEAIYYKRPLNKVSLGFAMVSFVGVLLVVQPQFLFARGEVAVVENFEFLSFLVIIAAVCFAMTMLYIHDLSKKISTIVNLHYSYMGHMTLTSIISNFHHPTVEFAAIDAYFLFAFALVVVFALLTQYMIYAATSLKQPSLTMPLGYLAIVVGFIADVTYFGTQFNLLSIAGIILTSVGLLSKLFIGENRGKGKSEPKHEHESSCQEQIEKI